MSKHTPGPWRATAALNENLVTVYTVRDSDNLPVGRGFRASDALLMAAAPELLDALKLFLKQYDACGPNSDFGRYFGNLRPVAAKAIASAEGDQ
jgi:hypothetical protein